MQAGLDYGHTYQMATYVNKRERWKSRAGDQSESALWEVRGLVLKKSLHQKLAASRLLSKMAKIHRAVSGELGRGFRRPEKHLAQRAGTTHATIEL